MTRLFRLAAAALLVLGLAACQSAEERAEDHYQSALALLAEGDLARATIEFRNVFELNGTHVEARRTYAGAIRDAGRTREAYSQFLRLVEQRPDDLEGRIALTEMAIDAQDWDQAQTHGTRAAELAPEDPRLVPILAILSYIDAVDAEDDVARQAASEAASAALQDTPGNLGLRQILIDDAMRNEDLDAALRQIDAALGIDADNRGLYDARLAILAQRGDGEALEAQLIDMVTRFPEDEALTATLLRFYIARDEMEAAEAFLRERIAAAPPEETDLRMALVQFVLQRDGAEAAMDELDTMIAAAGDGPTATVFGILRAGILFDSGAREAAITDLQALIDAGGGTQSDLNDARIALARMLSAEGNPVGGRRLVGEVLETDPANVEALKLEAGWFIDEDRPDAAISRLRTALEEAPDDVGAMTLMARAHERNGSRDLMRDFLALAYETSGSAPEETLRYVRVLVSEERYLSAEEALIAALRIAPDTPSLLDELGRLYIAMQDWPRAAHVEDTLRGLDGMEDLANEIRVQRLAARGNMDEAIAFLEGLADNGTSEDIGVDIAIIRARLVSGDIAGATAYLEDRLAEIPDNFNLRFVQASLWAGMGRAEEAERVYRDLIEERPEVEQLWIGLVRAHYTQGDTEAAEATLNEGLEVLPDALNLLWAQASFLENQADFEGAIGVYEIMYERAPDQPVIANNLASLISTYRTDDDSLERAYSIARRLRGSDFAPFQDTYGWIALRRGDLDEAGTHLEQAAATLADDPLVQFHYGMFLAADGQTRAAIDQLSRALDLAGPDDPRPQFETARAEIERLEAEAVENQ